jgi:predicted nucleic acid-binding protein
LIDFGLPDHLPRVLDLMRSYRDLPMSLADACLVCMAEGVREAKVFTTDSDFRTYRKNKRQVIPLIAP